MKAQKNKESIEELVALLCSVNPDDRQIALNLIRPMKTNAKKLVDKWVSAALKVYIADAATHVIPPLDCNANDVKTIVCEGRIGAKEWSITLTEGWNLKSNWPDNSDSIVYVCSIDVGVLHSWESATHSYKNWEHVDGRMTRVTTPNSRFETEQRSALNKVLILARVEMRKRLHEWATQLIKEL